MHGIFLVFCVLLVYNKNKKHKEILCVLDTNTTTKTLAKGSKKTMKANGIERDFLKEVREARPEDCKTIIEALYALDGREGEDGELTPLGFLVGAVVEELTINGIMKKKYGKEAEADV